MIMSNTCLVPKTVSLSIQLATHLSIYVCISCAPIVTKRISCLLVAYFVYLCAQLKVGVNVNGPLSLLVNLFIQLSHYCNYV